MQFVAKARRKAGLALISFKRMMSSQEVLTSFSSSSTGSIICKYQILHIKGQLIKWSLITSGSGVATVFIQSTSSYSIYLRGY